MTQPANYQQLAARLLYLTQQESALKTEKDQIKEQLDELYAGNLIPAKPDDIEAMFSDGTTRNIRLQRVSTGSYFKVADEYKSEYKTKSEKLNSEFIKAGKAEMAEKACTWRVREVKS